MRKFLACLFTPLNFCLMLISMLGGVLLQAGMPGQTRPVDFVWAASGGLVVIALFSISDYRKS